MRKKRSCRKPAILHRGLEIAAGGKNEPHINVNLVRGAKRPHHPSIQHTEQFRLKRQRHFTDGVEEERAGLSVSQKSGAVGNRIRESASRVAEELCLEQLGRRRRRVQRDERRFTAEACRVNSPSDEFLAASVSPVISSGREEAATCSIWRPTLRMALDEPSTRPKIPRLCASFAHRLPRGRAQHGREAPQMPPDPPREDFQITKTAADEIALRLEQAPRRAFWIGRLPFQVKERLAEKPSSAEHGIFERLLSRDERLRTAMEC
jgi:hypothetical protein